MKTSLLPKIAALLFTLGTFTAQAQSHHNQIAGIVQDSLSQKALPYATIILKKYSDTSFLQAVTTDEKGGFAFDRLPEGLYFVAADYLGYKKVKVDSVKVNASGQARPLSIALPMDAKLLKAVTVVGYKPLIEQHADKLVLNVAESPLAAGGTTEEVISRAPGVVEQNGNYLLRGRTALVLIDGKNTNLRGEDLKTYLSSLPSNGIAKVEVIANPSAKYDAAGGAIINIISAKNKNHGTSGTVTTGLGMGERGRYNGGLSLNYKGNKVIASGGYDFQSSQPFVKMQASRQLTLESGVQERSYEIRTVNTHSLRAGVDYDLSAKSSVGILVKGLVSLRERNGRNMAQVAQASGAPVSSSIVANTGKGKIMTPSVNLFYRTVLDSAGTELRVAADYFSYRKDLENMFSTTFFNAQQEPTQAPAWLRDDSPADNVIKTFTADVVRPLKKGSLELGLKATFTITDNDIFWESRTQETDWAVDAGKTNHFVYRENINAAYASYNTTFQKLSVQVGVRAEQTLTKATSLTLAQTNYNDYFNLFPSVSGQYKLSDKQQLGVSYRKKIDRFRFDIVNPFVSYISQYSYAQGNPAVKPSLSHNFEVSHSYNNEWFTAFSYGYHLNVLSEIVKPLAGTEAVVNSFANFGSAVQVTGNLTHVKSLFKNKWNTSNTVGYIYANVHTGGEARFSQAQASFMLSSHNTLTLGHGFRGEVSGSYTSPMAFGAYAFKAQYGTNVGISKSVLDNQGTLTLNVSDVFNTRVTRYTAASYGVRSVNESQAESRFVRLNFSYKFGNKNVKASRARRTGAEEEKSRMEREN